MGEVDTLNVLSCSTGDSAYHLLRHRGSEQADKYYGDGKLITVVRLVDGCVVMRLVCSVPLVRAVRLVRLVRAVRMVCDSKYRMSRICSPFREVHR